MTTIRKIKNLFHIPIREEFNTLDVKDESHEVEPDKKIESNVIPHENEINEDFIYLIMGGGYGIGDIKNYVNLILENESNETIKKCIIDKKQHILSTKEIIKDEYISINITRNNISTLLKKRMMDSEESDDDIENCLAILNSIIND